MGLGFVDGPKQLQPVALCLSRDGSPPLEFVRTYEHLTPPRGTRGSVPNFGELRQGEVLRPRVIRIGGSPRSPPSRSGPGRRPCRPTPPSPVREEHARPMLLLPPVEAGALYPRHHLQVEDGEAARVGLLHAQQGHVPPPR